MAQYNFNLNCELKQIPPIELKNNSMSNYPVKYDSCDCNLIQKDSGITSLQTLKLLYTNLEIQSLQYSPDDTENEKIYQKYREQAIKQRSKMNQKSRNNQNMKRTNTNINSDLVNDPEYLNKRKKNNEAAKRSRDSRKEINEERTIRVCFLKDQNYELKLMVKKILQNIAIINHLLHRFE